MEIYEREGLNFQLNPEDLTASIVESPNAFGSVVIPHHFRFQRQNYMVTAIKSNAFYQNTIDSIKFAKNSEVTTFEDEAFQNSSIKMLQIPPKLRVIENRCFFLLKDLTEIDVSPKNNLFSFYNDELLIGKSQEDLSFFDILYLGRSDLKEVVIPSSIRTIKRYAFGESPDLESIKFEKNSQLEFIEGWVLCENLKRFEIPKNLKKTEKDAFRYACSLINIDVSPENEVYSWEHNTFLIRKEAEKKAIAFCSRDATNVTIPKDINEIDAYAFTKCNLESISFEDNSKLEVINEDAFENVPGPKKIKIPPSVKIVKSYAFCYMENLTSIEFLSEEIEIESNCFYSSDNLISISFPNAKKIIFNDSLEEAIKIYLRKDAEISGNVDKNSDHIEFIKEEVKSTKVENENQINTNKQHQNDPIKEIKSNEIIQENNNESSKCCLLL